MSVTTVYARMPFWELKCADTLHDKMCQRNSEPECGGRFTGDDEFQPKCEDSPDDSMILSRPHVRPSMFPA